MHKIEQENIAIPQDVDRLSVNPTLSLRRVSHKNLVSLLDQNDPEETKPVQASDHTHILSWRHPETEEILMREANDGDLLALKIVVEDLDIREAAASGGVSIGVIDSVINQAISNGLVLSPKPLVQRGKSLSQAAGPDFAEYISADVFTLQWHITQACDLHCKHCYDRSDRAPMPFETALAILDDFYDFCRKMHVKGQVTFTGGNPLLYPNFAELYREATERGFGLAILGNPTPRHNLEKLLAIEPPLFFQVSLEGLEEHNDKIRGKGHFQRTLAFLDLLRELDIYSMVMLTLTRDNMNQVLPLANILRDRTDSFTFNRLSTVGEGAQLLMADPVGFRSFLEKYESESRQNPIVDLKDNLLNVTLSQNGTGMFGGCTGYGCGAAFNFVALLPDGEVHACRKFPSPLGNILQSRLMDIYHSELAQKYRGGSSACGDCRLNAVCRGCLAIAYSQGLDVFAEKDPFCFLESAAAGA